jgi:hypothetical protein
MMVNSVPSSPILLKNAHAAACLPPQVYRSITSLVFVTTSMYGTERMTVSIVTNFQASEDL